MKKKFFLSAAPALFAALLLLHPTPLFCSVNIPGQQEEAGQADLPTDQIIMAGYITSQEEGALMEEAEGVPGEEEYLPEMEEKGGVVERDDQYVPQTYEEEAVPEATDEQYLPEEQGEGEAEAEIPADEYLPEMEEAHEGQQ